MFGSRTNLRYDGHRQTKAPEIVSIVTDTAKVAIPDANKVLLLESEGAIGTIVTGLLLSSPWCADRDSDVVWLHGGLLSDDSLFEGQVSELCRDLGDCGHHFSTNV